MQNINQNLLASDIVKDLSKISKDGKTSLGDIVLQFHDIGFSIIMILLSLPIAIPLPYPPGSTAIFGIPLMILSFQMIIGWDNIHLPRKIAKYKVSNKRIILFANKALPILKKIEKFLKRRFEFAASKYVERVIGVISFICAICIASPIPFTHAIPAWGISIMSLGLLKKDGLVVFIGMVVSFIGLVISYGATILFLKILGY